MYNNFDSQILENKKILIVDDNALNRKILKEQLLKMGVIVTMAENGAEGIKVAKDTIPDLILLDIMMPLVNGYEVCKSLKEDYSTRDIPIIFLSAKIDSEDIVKGLRLGAVDYINKPFLHPEELLARISTHIEIKIYRDSLVVQNERLNSINQEKNDFIATIVHDLKNPVFNISLIAKTILKDKNINKEDIKDLAQDIEKSSDKILSLINSILDLASYENNREIRYEQININETLFACITLQKENAKRKNIKLNLDLSETQIDIVSDRTALMQIFDNIISNAIKYSFLDTEVNINYNISDNQDYVIINIEDSGPGISPEDQKKMFGKFTKLTAKPTGDESSSGLGLYAVKISAELINADIKISSTMGKGSIFSIYLPYNP
ncbi:MAG: hybrid sensor histidine kinase/response regulator [Candidatus Kapaibacteriota bacterium]|jgi:two-component system sensor histidine kinase/response regulator